MKTGKREEAEVKKAEVAAAKQTLQEIERTEGSSAERLSRFKPAESLLQSSKSGVLFHHAAA